MKSKCNEQPALSRALSFSWAMVVADHSWCSIFFHLTYCLLTTPNAAWRQSVDVFQGAFWGWAQRLQQWRRRRREEAATGGCSTFPVAVLLRLPRLGSPAAPSETGLFRVPHPAVPASTRIRDSSVSAATRLRVRQLRNRDLISGRCSGPHLASNLVDTLDSP